MLKKQEKRQKRANRVRAKAKAGNRPRLSVFRSNQHISVQIINDQNGQTLLSFSDAKLKNQKKTAKMEMAKEVGKKIAGLALENKIKEVVFDRSGYRYHGRVKAVAEGAREAGLIF